MGRTRWTGAQGLIGVLAALGVIGAPWSAADADPNPGAVNFVEILTARTDDFPFDKLDVFFLELDLFLPSVPGITGVTATRGDGQQLILLNGGDGEWYGDADFVDLATMKAAMNGTWTINIAGGSPSTSTFTFNAAALQDSDFFSTPTDLFPVHDSTDVPADVIFSWSDPTGTATPDALAVFADGPSNTEQDDDSIMGTLNITDTSWDPPLDLEGGLSEFGVLYINFDDAVLVGPLTVTAGSIVWGNSIYAPKGYPASTPLLILGSETIVGFTVVATGKCPTDLNGDGSVGILDLLALLAAWGSNPGGPPDFDGDGTVGILDLLALLANWGPCS